MKARHSVLAVLFVTWIVSHVDRMAMSVTLPYISADFHLSPLQSGILLSAFFAGYSISHIPGGLLADTFGVRRVATIAMLWWSAFTAITGAAANLTQMLVSRFVFGLGEGVFPACAFKTIAIWFPKEERATANAIMLASNPLGAALAPLAVVGIMSLGSWRTVFYSLFVPGVLIALLFWKLISNRPSDSHRISPGELAEIERSDRDYSLSSENKVNLLTILKEPNILKLFIVLFTFDIAYWGFTAWLPTYLVKVRGFSMVQMGVAASLPFFVGTAGCVAGGWISDRYFSNNRRLPIVMTQLISAVFLYLTFSANSIAVLVISQTLAGAFLNVFFSAFWALPMNSVPKELMGVASGFINMAGQIAAFISPLVVGYIVNTTGGKFDLGFLFLIGSLFVSSAVVFMISSRAQLSPREFVSN